MRTTIHILSITALTVALAAPAAARSGRDVDDESAALHREIAALRMVHELDLSQEQIDELVPLVEEGIGLAEELRELRDEARKDNLPVLRRVRDDLADDGELSEETRDAAEHAAKEAEKVSRIAVLELRDLAEEVMDVLDEEQREKVQRVLSAPPGPRRHHRRDADARPDDAGPPPAATDRGAAELPPPLLHEIRQHNARQLFSTVFSAEFLDVLLDR